MRQVVAGCVALVVLAGCSSSRPFGGEGPLRALTGQGASIGPAVKKGQDTKTWTFGTELCSEDPDAEIVIDAVRYDTVPELPAWRPDEELPSIGARIRTILPPEKGEKVVFPIGSSRGGPDRLRGDVSDLGEELSHGVTPCEQYDEDSGGPRSWQVVEVLTVLTVGPEGGLARRTHLDYHVGDDEYTISWSWKVGLCGTAVPAGNDCGRPTG